jgi:hypothetical protein
MREPYSHTSSQQLVSQAVEMLEDAMAAIRHNLENRSVFTFVKHGSEDSAFRVNSSDFDDVFEWRDLSGDVSAVKMSMQSTVISARADKRTVIVRKLDKHLLEAAQQISQYLMLNKRSATLPIIQESWGGHRPAKN